MAGEPRTRSPFLVPGKSIGDYVFEDLLDACTPGELSTASWNLMLHRVLEDPAWVACKTKTFFLSSQRREDPRTFFKGDTRDVPYLRIFARRLEEDRVVRRAWGYLMGNLPDRAAFTLPMLLSVGPVVFMDTPTWAAKVLPATGPSRRANGLRVNEVTQILGYEFELETRPEEQGIIMKYGFNPIPQFRRLFELHPPSGPLP